MFNRMINWVKSIFHEETPEEQDKRIHETIKTWKDNVDKEELAYIDAYYNECRMQIELVFGLRALPKQVSANHLILWSFRFPELENKDNALNAWTKWHEAHEMLAGLYHFMVTDPPDGSCGRFNKYIDLRPAKWLKDLANEEKIIKALQIEASAKQYQV